ncbi:Bor/Iss family lipoprotein [Thalassotalea sp. PS06]|uniref:Bor/Iss family lipoprotein n=1 Tax=Thalassotalea sp. PS06 TaxID=2594005 RepID=UPI001162D5DF|nr:hypothetical protein [Thalassotalea sp. PS06]QDP02818.1 hypothetical protein FNC98_16620 [Thalassotalea sp. PS06]
MKKTITLISALMLSACTTIHFDKEPAATTAVVKKEEWHHNLVLALYEASDPVALNNICGEQEWVTVKTETSFLNGLASSATSAVVGPLWTPKTVEISCK